MEKLRETDMGHIKTPTFKNPVIRKQGIDLGYLCLFMYLWDNREAGRDYGHTGCWVGGSNHHCLSLSLLRHDFSDMLNWL